MDTGVLSPLNSPTSFFAVSGKAKPLCRNIHSYNVLWISSGELLGVLQLTQHENVITSMDL